ncbi:hypothetical protein [Acinetobacter sp. MB5]|uniref:hypothetical protein n=1 Tax=Acinetobacter sp. MB5 TaxID=2069438 RepID=UPI000DD075FD|nr:hypothetical protein [Acinetobacter sp. MB5]
MNTERVHAIDQQELQHLISVSTGFIDAYIIECYNQVPMLIPQNIVLSAQNSDTQVKTLSWHDVNLPVYAINNPNTKEGIALVIEGDEITQRFVLLCSEMPQGVRLRISEVIDDERPVDDAKVFQYVVTEGKQYQIPNLVEIQRQIGIAV